MPAVQTRVKAKPLLKWPGGKRRLLKYLLPLVPKRFGRYHEPFFGGGALFFALQPAGSLLSDTNPELINCYLQVRNRPEQMIGLLQGWENSEEAYTQIRSWTPDNALQRAARLIYLTRLSFNGIYRLNSRGEFNVPYGHRDHMPTCDPEQIRALSSVLASSRLNCDDFDAVERRATAGDLVYFDPPYVLPDDNSGFVRYNGHGRNFRWDDQIRLAKAAQRLRTRGVCVLVSNADHPEIRRLYHGFRRKIIHRSSTIAADGAVRRVVAEAVFHT